MALSSSVHGLTVGEIGAHIAQIYDARVAEEMNERSHRPLDGVYAAIGVSLDEENDSLGLRSQTGGEGAKFGMSVLTGIKDHGVTDTFFLVFDESKAFPKLGQTSGLDVRP